MKKLLGIGLLALMVSSCSLFQKPSMTQDQINAMVAENQALKAQASESKDLEDQLALQRMQLDEAMLKLAACEESAKSKVHIIVGAFKTSSYADEYSAEMKTRGYDGKIMAGPYNFNLVTAGSYESINAALNALYSIRDNVIETAWIYIE
ncbi:MAG: SPOR domain-containing protein [Bacteroidales bacterium]|nr:SPOR domain-containing protein [Bacteroidales bacterium]